MKHLSHQPSRRPRHWFLAAALIGFSALAPQADACRDCPFPMRVGDHWLMPSGNITVFVESISHNRTIEIERVSLYDAHSGALIASGMSRRALGGQVIDTNLFDRDGHLIRAYVRYVDNEHESIQVKFSCSDCAYRDALD